MSQTSTYENMLRIHDKAIYSWLGDLNVDYGEIAGNTLPQSYIPILRVFASPMRAFAEMRDTLIRKGWIQRPTEQELLDDAEAYKLVPLPFISIYREAPENDPTRAMIPGQFTGLLYDASTGEKVDHPYPGTYLINYQVDFWCLKRYTEAHIYEWVKSKLGKVGAAPNEAMVPVEHDAPWGVKLQGMKMTGFVDNTELEGFADSKRYVRFTATFQLNALLFRPTSSYKPAFTFKSESRIVTFADGKTDMDGYVAAESSKTAEIDVFRDDLIIPESQLSDLFRFDGNVQFARTLLSSDGRFNRTSLRPRGGEYGSFRVTVNDATSWFGNAYIAPPNAQTPVVVRFAYMSQNDFIFRILDENGDYLQTWTLPATSRWQQFETFFVTDSMFRFRWWAVTDGDIYIDRTKFAVIDAYSNSAISATSSSIIGSDRVVQFEGLDWSTGYIVSGNLLNTTSVYDIVIVNGETSPTNTERITVGNDSWSSFGVIMQPKYKTDKIIIRLESVTDDVDNAEVRAYNGQIKGRFVDIR